MFIMHRAVDFLLFVHIQIDCMDNVSTEILYKINHPPPPSHFLLSFSGSRRSNVDVKITVAYRGLAHKGGGGGGMTVQPPSPFTLSILCGVVWGGGNLLSSLPPPPPRRFATA